MFNASAPWGILAYEKAVYLDELSDAAIEVILEQQPKKAFPLSFLPIFVLGGAYSRAAEDATAFGGSRSAHLHRQHRGRRSDAGALRDRAGVGADVLVGAGAARRGRRQLRELHDRTRAKTACVRPTGRRSTSGWQRSRRSTTRRTCST